MNNFILYYGVLNDTGEGLQYQVKLDKETPEKDIDTNIYRVAENVLPTYHSELPTGTEVTLYVGDLYPENQIVRVYSYDTMGQYIVITPGTYVKGGYVTFKTTYQKNYIITTNNLIEDDKSFMAFIQQNQELIKYAGIGVVFLILWSQIIKIMKKRKMKQI